MTQYAVVPARGCYSRTEIVKAVRTFGDPMKAGAFATRRTADWQRRCPGHSSGGYRVIALRDGERATWLGIDLDAR